MWFLIFFGFPVLEIWLLFKVGDQIGLANTFFYLLACAVIGIGLIRTQGAFLMRTMQATMAQGQIPSVQLFHSLAIFMAGGFFIFPGYISSVIAVLLLLPGSRHLAVFLMRQKLASMLAKGSMRFAGSFGGPGGFASWTSSAGPRGPLRDVSPLEIRSQSSNEESEVIDVTPIKKD